MMWNWMLEQMLGVIPKINADEQVVIMVKVNDSADNEALSIPARGGRSLTSCPNRLSMATSRGSRPAYTDRIVDTSHGTRTIK
jgi:hypothetical protein